MSEDRQSVAAGRAALEEWERRQPANFYESDRHLQRVLERHWEADGLRARAAQLSKFGGEAATVVDRAVRRANETPNLPRLERYSAAGVRTEEVIHSADHHLAGRYIYGSGAMACYAEPGANLMALALFYLSSHNGEAGHNCPLACTAGVIKILQQVGSDELKERYLPRLLDPDYGRRFDGAQFLTEVQGGSDVGANACRATPLEAGRGTWQVNGEKWFCSNVTAELALVTARPDGAPGGTRGLGLFLVPRRLGDGGLNGLHIRRLKDKLGTRSLATAEVDLHDALAFEVGAPERGFEHVMDFVVNTSRLYNALGSAGAARRAYLIARGYAGHRRAFGEAIRNFAPVAVALAEMRAQSAALASAGLYLARLRDELESGRAGETAAPFFRLAVNLNKYRSSVAGTDVVRRGIELLGGNGAMENFSVLPRLLRDSLIFEAWEGAHNTLLAQSLRDLRRHRLHEAFCARLDGMLGGARPEVARLRDEIEAVLGAGEAVGSLRFRRLADRMMDLFYAACLGRDAEPAVAEFWRRWRVEGAVVDDLPLIDAVLSEE